MEEKPLKQVAWEAMNANWDMDAEDSWQAVADAVVAAHEARQWKAIESAPKNGTLVFVGKRHRGEWLQKQTHFVAVAQEDGYTHWTPIPAPPQEVER